MDKNNQLLGQVGEALGTRLRDQNEAIRAIMQKLNITDQDLNLLKQQIRLRPSGQ
jgi:hypothetical protein